MRWLAQQDALVTRRRGSRSRGPASAVTGDFPTLLPTPVSPDRQPDALLAPRRFSPSRIWKPRTNRHPPRSAVQAASPACRFRELSRAARGPVKPGGAAAALASSSRRRR
eukprot:351032-Chlamydomonas_euryale.AAC.7